MQKQAYERLKNILATGKYRVNKENGCIISNNGKFANKQIGNWDPQTENMKVLLKYKGKQYSYKIQDIIMTAAGHDLIDKKVIHKDNRRWNNRLENLEMTN